MQWQFAQYIHYAELNLHGRDTHLITHKLNVLKEGQHEKQND